MAHDLTLEALKLPSPSFRLPLSYYRLRGTCGCDAYENCLCRRSLFSSLIRGENVRFSVLFVLLQVVEFNVDSGAMALDRWNLFRCGVFRYSCALENVSKLEITEVRGACCSARQPC